MPGLLTREDITIMRKSGLIILAVYRNSVANQLAVHIITLAMISARRTGSVERTFRDLIICHYLSKCIERGCLASAGVVLAVGWYGEEGL